MTTIAEYSANSVNPWHFWLEENVDVAYRPFVVKTVQYQRFMDHKGWTLAFVETKLRAFAKANNLDFDKACDFWVAYEEFKTELTEYRLEKVGA